MYFVHLKGILFASHIVGSVIVCANAITWRSSARLMQIGSETLNLHVICWWGYIGWFKDFFSLTHEKVYLFLKNKNVLNYDNLHRRCRTADYSNRLQPIVLIISSDYAYGRCIGTALLCIIMMITMIVVMIEMMTTIRNISRDWPCSIFLHPEVEWGSSAFGNPRWYFAFVGVHCYWQSFVGASCPGHVENIA